MHDDRNIPGLIRIISRAETAALSKLAIVLASSGVVEYDKSRKGPSILASNASGCDLMISSWKAGQESHFKETLYFLLRSSPTYRAI